MGIDSAARERYSRNQSIANRRRRMRESLDSVIPLRMFKSDGTNPTQKDLDRNMRAATLLHLWDLQQEKDGTWQPEEE